jgi:small multidrug resistance pump
MVGMDRFRPWFYAAATYNVLWGAWVVLYPHAVFNLIHMKPPEPIAIWQCVGMMVLAYAPGYWLVARDPERYAPLVWVGLLGKTLGPIGFLFAALDGQLPWSFGWILVFNDLIWHPAFWWFGLRFARSHKTSKRILP